MAQLVERHVRRGASVRGMRLGVKGVAKAVDVDDAMGGTGIGTAIGVAVRLRLRLVRRLRWRSTGALHLRTTRRSMQRRVRVRMRRLARVLRGPMVDAGGVDVVGAGVAVELPVSRRLRRRRKAVRMRLLLRLRRWTSARRERLKDGRLSRARSVHRVRVDASVVAGSVAGATAEDANVVAGNLAAGTSGWIRCGSGLRRVARGRLRRMMRLSI